MFTKDIKELKVLTEQIENVDDNLIKQSRNWEYAFNAIPDAVFITNENFDIKFINTAAIKRFNVKENDIVNFKCYELIFGCDTATECVCNGENGVPKFYGEVYSKRSNRWYLYDRAPVLDNDKNTFGHINILRDITEEKASNEARLETEAKLKEMKETKLKENKERCQRKLCALIKENKDIKILIVDDDQTILDVLGEMLKLENYNVFTAINGQTALDLFEKEQPDIIVVDVYLPDISGLDVIAEIKKSVINYVPIIIISGASYTEDIAKIFETTNCDYLKKPIELNVFSRSIERNLKMARVMEENRLIHECFNL